MTLAAMLQLESRTIISAGPDTIVREIVSLLGQHRIGAVPIVEGDAIRGILSERDVIYALGREGSTILEWPASRVMTAPAITVDASITPLAGLSLMTQRRIRHLPLVEEGRLVGFVSIGDLVKARIELIEREADAMRAYIAS